MSRNQLGGRCAESEFIDIGFIDNHELVFPRFSKKRNCGVASIVPSKGSTVWGVIFKLTASDIAALDKSEGYVLGRQSSENSYTRTGQTIRVNCNAGRTLSCFSYIAVPQSGTFAPSRDYINLIIGGATENRLPEDYILALSAIAAS